MNNTQIKKEHTPLIGAVIAMEPYRPLFAVITLALTGWAGWRRWQGRKVCIANDCPPNKPMLLWMLGGLAVFLLLSPSLLPYLIKQGI